MEQRVIKNIWKRIELIIESFRKTYEHESVSI